MSSAERALVIEIAGMIEVQSSPEKSASDAAPIADKSASEESCKGAAPIADSPPLDGPVLPCPSPCESEDDDFAAFAEFVSHFQAKQTAPPVQDVCEPPVAPAAPAAPVCEPPVAPAAPAAPALASGDSLLLEAMLAAKPLPPKRKPVAPQAAKCKREAKIKAEAKPKAKAKGKAEPLKMSRHNVYSRAYHRTLAETRCKATARAAAQAAVAQM